MAEFQSEAEFAKNLNTTFRVEGDGVSPVDLKLVAVTPKRIEPNEQVGMERFSALFAGPLDVQLPQQIYRIAHPDMGEFEIFLVAVAREPDGFRYEAVYNYYRND